MRVTVLLRWYVADDDSSAGLCAAEAARYVSSAHLCRSRQDMHGSHCTSSVIQSACVNATTCRCVHCEQNRSALYFAVKSRDPGMVRRFLKQEGTNQADTLWVRALVYWRPGVVVLTYLHVLPYRDGRHCTSQQ